MARLSLAARAERLVYRIAGLPVAVAGLFVGGDDPLRTVVVSRYWRPSGAGEWTELVFGLITWPIALVLGATWYTARNGAIIRRRYGSGIGAQFGDQVRLYFSNGVLAPWYYTFALHDDGARRAGTFIQRFETKPAIFPLLKGYKGSPLNQKDKFAEYCAERGLRCIPIIARLGGPHPAPALPDRDLFVKPVAGRGGTGAQRWDNVAAGVFASPGGERLKADELFARLVVQSRKSPLIVQPRLKPHPEFAEITTGALPTTRVLTCLNEQGEPEVVAAMFRTSFGSNVTVDNMHAGGLGALIDIGSGRLGRASNIGADARLGWHTAHPDTGAPIEGRTLPLWNETKALALHAHEHFNDRVVVGWDVAILGDGPILVEGNGNPDLDILQRFMPIGFRRHRLGELIAFHLRSRLRGRA